MIAKFLYNDGFTYRMIERKAQFIGYSVAKNGIVDHYIIYKIGVDRNGTEYLGEPIKGNMMTTLKQFIGTWNRITNDKCIQHISDKKQKSL